MYDNTLSRYASMTIHLNSSSSGVTWLMTSSAHSDELLNVSLHGNLYLPMQVRLPVTFTDLHFPDGIYDHLVCYNTMQNTKLQRIDIKRRLLGKKA